MIGKIGNLIEANRESGTGPVVLFKTITKYNTNGSKRGAIVIA